jgi:hypothetical protein
VHHHSRILSLIQAYETGFVLRHPVDQLVGRSRAVPSWSVVRLSDTFRYGIVIELESLGFAEEFASSCELEALHLVSVLLLGEEFHEDVVFGGIEEEFMQSLT